MDTQTAELIAARIRDLLLKEAASGRTIATLDDIETVSLELRRKAGELVAEELAAKTAKSHEQAEGAEEAGKLECRCGRTARFKGYRWHDVVMMSATLRVQRRYYYCRLCDSGFCPADARLGLCGSAYTGQVQHQVARLCAMAPYAVAAETFESLCGVCVSPSHCQQMVEWVDRRAVAYLRGQERLAFADRVPSGPAVDVLYVEADGVHTPVIGGWREMKVGVCFEKNASGARVGKRYVSHLGTAEAFGEAWYSMAAHRGAERARRVVVLGDGAHWIWNQAQMHFPQAIQILDLWHVLERLWEVGRAAFGLEDSSHLRDWVETQKTFLDLGQVGSFLGGLEVLQEQHPDCVEIGEALTYYRNNQCRMDYPRYRSLGLDVGSGAAESGCKQVVSQRLKGAGMRWREAGASAIARLRCLMLSLQWSEVASRCNTRPLALTTA
jgi:hypothetical protein